ncbi:hypothetical protein HU200_062179 [Digitaria exilis]|uniref:Serine-threonine/tyrosine-protein kinase catalytic domain-containing protein n=1 Tax=Digitaria exilis TaxID=1010633 RepID=A0A835A6N9_9POAL|nr:hypothetical protein HU200_062179 [Digitaria exilis]
MGSLPTQWNAMHCQALNSAAGLPIGLLRRRAPLQGSSEEKNAQLATWNASTPLCLWRGLRWSTTAGARANLSLTGDPTILLVSPRPRSPGHSRRSSGPSPRWRPSTYLSANSLTGAVPLELGNAPALTALDLSRNRLSGALPASLCDHGVTELRLHGNALTGAIPEPAAPNTTCDALRALNLSYNSFSGQLPAASLATSSPDSFVGNVCGPPLRQPCVSSSSGLSSRHGHRRHGRSRRPRLRLHRPGPPQPGAAQGILPGEAYPRARTLHDLLLHKNTNLTWPRRHKMALGAARALAYLHAGQGEAHGIVRSSTVLVVDEVARLAEHAVHRLLVPPAAVRADGYKAPELQSMRRCSARTDVYAFWILLLELLMGRRRRSWRRRRWRRCWTRSCSRSSSPAEEGMLQALKLAMGCCAPVPAMPEVVRQLEDIRPRHPRSSPAESRSDAGTPTTTT